MIEMRLLKEAKETENKVRWDADVEGTKFSPTSPNGGCPILGRPSSGVWEIGEPYIPIPLTHGEQDRLTVAVEWV